PSANHLVSRARIGYTAKANNDLKFVSMFELDYNYWGNSSYVNARGGGGALGADTVNIETKNLYLDANVAKNTNLKLGMQGYSDAFKGAFVDADMAGALVSHSYDKATAAVGFFRWEDKATTTLGRQTRDVLVLDGKYDLSKHTKLGAAYYFVKDNSKNFADANQTIHVLGVNAESVVGAVTLDGFLAAQLGEVENTQKDLSAYAASVGAKMKIGKGALRADILYTSGDNGAAGKSKSHAWQSISNTGKYSETGYYAHEMVILGRDKYATTIDNAIVMDASNANHGVIFATLGYDMPITSKLDGSANVGFARNDKARTGDVNTEKNLGTELNAELVYKATDNVSISTRAAYVFLGDHFRGVATNGTPDNPYDFKIVAKYSF
ncbi:MAG: porin, partial [Geobacteraceae bacterium]|nr:porin [Geobacteraceae bacterium]